MTITTRPRWSLGRGNQVVPSRWQATFGLATCWTMGAPDTADPATCSLITSNSQPDQIETPSAAFEKQRSRQTSGRVKVACPRRV